MLHFCKYLKGAGVSIFYAEISKIRRPCVNKTGCITDIEDNVFILHKYYQEKYRYIRK